MQGNTGVNQTNRPTNQKGSNIDQQLIHDIIVDEEEGMAVGIITSKEMTNCLFSSAYGHPHYCVFV